MATTLYQKYRPATFADVIGQDHIITTLQNELAGGAVAHAYLFSGSRGVGKTTTARLLARAVNCVAEDVATRPCNECAHCVSSLEGRAIDIIEIDAASHTGVDNVRENIIEHARVAPAQFSWKVFIIDEVHMLSGSAFNALLKTLEEPPAKTMFILATTETHKVPATIASRCEQFQFRRVEVSLIAQRLQGLATKEGRELEELAALAIARRADGGLRDAESLLGQVLSSPENPVTLKAVEVVLPHADKKEILTWVTEVFTGRFAEGAQRISAWYVAGNQMPQYIVALIEVVRAGMLYRLTSKREMLEQLLLEPAQVDFLEKLFGRVDVQRVTRVLQLLVEALESQKTTAVETVPLEIVVATLAGEQGGFAEVTELAPVAAMPVAETPETVPQEPVHAAPAAAVETPLPTAGQPIPMPKKKVESAEAKEEAEQLPVIQVEDDVPAAVLEEDEPTSESEDVAAPLDIQTEATVEEEVVPIEEMVSVETIEESVPATVDVSEAAPFVSAPQAAPAPNATVPADGSPMERVRAQWNDILKAIQSEDHALYLTFKVSTLVEAKEGELTLGFEYQFYKDRLEEPVNHKKVETAVSAVLGSTYRVVAVVSQDFAKEHQNVTVENIEQPTEEEATNVWDLATQHFGPSVTS